MKHFKDNLSNILELPLGLKIVQQRGNIFGIFIVNDPVVVSLFPKIVQYFELCCGVSGETK